MRRRPHRRQPAPAEEHIRPEVHQKVHQQSSQETPQKESKGLSKTSKIFWTVMVFFFISAAAYYLDALINGGG